MTAPAQDTGPVIKAFARAKGEGRGALVPFVVGGYPSLDATAEVVAQAGHAGADVLEIGLPFSDPIADGPVIANAMHDTLTAGVTPRAVIERVGAAASDGVAPALVAMVSVSVVLRGSPAAFAKLLADHGFSGVILPDAPLEEAQGYLKAFASAGLAVTLLIAPTTPADRAAAIARACTGFVYVLARTGITGAATDVGGVDLKERIETLRGQTDRPLACGFGIDSAESVRRVIGAGADGAIVGTALVKRMGGVDAGQAALAFIRELASGLRG